MLPTRSPSIPPAVSGGALDLSLSGSRLTLPKRPSNASPGKLFTRSASVSASATDGRAKRNTPLGDVPSQRSIKNLRRSNSTTQVNHRLSDGQRDDFLAVIDSGSDGRRKSAGLRRTSPDRTTWNILDEQPRVLLHSSSRSISSADSPTAGVASAATFTANNRSNKGAVGNSVTTILHNNYSDKPLTPKSSNQRPSFNNILKANDEVPVGGVSLTKSQKNFSSPSSSSNNRSPVSPPSPRREVTEEEAERFIQQVNHAAVTIQRWYRRHAARSHAHQGALQRILAGKRKEWEERTEEDSRLEKQQRKEEDRKRIREEKARLARLAAIQELQQKRARRAEEVQHVTAEAQPQSLRAAGGVARRRPPPTISLTNQSPATSPSKNSPLSPTDMKTKNTDSHLNLVAEEAELNFRAVSPAASSGGPASHYSQEAELKAEEAARLDEDKRLHKGRMNTTQQVLQQRRLRQAAEASVSLGAELERLRPPPPGGRRRLLRASSSNYSPTSPSNNSPLSPTDMKTNNTGSHLNVVCDGAELGFRAASPAPSNHRGSHSSQRSLSVEEQQHGAPCSRTPSKSALNELLDTLKLLEEEPERLGEPREKAAWPDEDADSNSLTTDNLERHGQLSHHHALPDGGALLSDAKLQSIMSFLDEMEKSEQERPRSVTSGSHREAVLSEEELAGVEQASATAAELSGSMMRIRMELEEKKRSVTVLQTALAQQRELTVRQAKETERELSRSFQLQKEQYEATIQRHLTFIDQLISDKKALSERCEGVLGELQQVDHKYTQKMSQMQQQHQMEIKKLKELMSASEKIRREKWIDEKTKKIKEITVKGLEPEIQKLISKHKQELKKLRTLHEAELLRAEERAAQRYVSQSEELRQQLEKERDEQCRREREHAKLRFEKQLQEEELSLQQQRRRLHKEVSEEKERLEEVADRQRSELEELRRQLEENSSVTGRVLREEQERSRAEQESRHQTEMKGLTERLELEKQSWEENYRKKEEAWLRKTKEELRRDRDKEIELAIWTLEEETTKDKEESERAAENRVKRVREKYEEQLKEAERSERAAVEKQQELRRQQLQREEELLLLQAALRRKQQEVEELTQSRDEMAEERRRLSDVIREEFAERLVATEEENRRAKGEVSEMRARLRLEVEKVTREKEEELAEVHQRVKSAILKKEETIGGLRKQHEAALKRAEHLEALWEQQRKQLLEK